MRKPWNIVSTPVYSLATYDEDRVNMNICTYVMPSSMRPKQYAIAVYYNTKTYENISKNPHAVLQILSEEHLGLIQVFGKKSGRKFDKFSYLTKRELIMRWKGKDVLKDCCGYIGLEVIGRTATGGDHELFWFSARNYSTMRDEGILTSNFLIEKGAIL